jgi:hypothetical protein
MLMMNGLLEVRKCERGLSRFIRLKTDDFLNQAYQFILHWQKSIKSEVSHFMRGPTVCVFVCWHLKPDSPKSSGNKFLLNIEPGEIVQNL